MDTTSSSTKPKKKNLLIVGSNPSSSAGSFAAFSDTTNSGRKLNEWLKLLEGSIDRAYKCNVYDKPTDNNRPLKTSEIKSGCTKLMSVIEAFEPDVVVALGKTASKALTLLGIKHYEMPHPSGLNRQLNDPAYIAEKIKGLEALLQPTP